MNKFTEYSADDVKRIREKFPNKRLFRVITKAESDARGIDGGGIRDNAKKANKAKNIKAEKANTWYIPIQTLDINGKYVDNVDFKLTKQLMGGAVKPQPKSTADTCSYMSLVLRRLKPNDLEGSNYHVSKHAELLAYNAEACDMLDYIADELMYLADDLRQRAAEYIPDVKTGDMMSSFRQSTTLNEETNEEEPIDPIYRLRMDVDKFTRRFGRSFPDKSGTYQFSDTVFDSRKIDANGNALPASVVNPTTGTQEALTSKNCDQFLTYLSIFSGKFNVKTAVVYKDGVSTPVTLRKGYFIPHIRAAKPKYNPGADLGDYVIEQQVEQQSGVVDVDSSAVADDGDAPILAAPPAPY